VINQNYSSGTQLKRGSTVTITVSAGQKPTEPTTTQPPEPTDDEDGEE